MMGLDAFWVVGWGEELHETAASGLIGAIAESVHYHENLPLAMITGYKCAAVGTDIDNAPALG